MNYKKEHNINAEIKTLCENCMHEQVCGKKNNCLEILKDFQNYKSSVNTNDVVVTIKCNYYMQKPTRALTNCGEIVGYY